MWTEEMSYQRPYFIRSSSKSWVPSPSIEHMIDVFSKTEVEQLDIGWDQPVRCKSGRYPECWKTAPLIMALSLSGWQYLFTLSTDKDRPVCGCNSLCRSWHPLLLHFAVFPMTLFRTKHCIPCLFLSSLFRGSFSTSSNSQSSNGMAPLSGTVLLGISSLTVQQYVFSPSEHREKPYFPAYLIARSGHMVRLECEEKWCGPLLPWPWKVSTHAHLYSFPLIWLLVDDNEFFRHEESID